MKLLSGSGANRVPKKPKHFELMRQLGFIYERINNLMKIANNLISTIQKQSAIPRPPSPNTPNTDQATDHLHHFTFFLTIVDDRTDESPCDNFANTITHESN